MSFLAKFEIDGEVMNVLEFQFSIGQDIDKSGKPSADPNGGRFRVVLESTKSTMLFDWMISNNQTKNGKVTFFRRDAVSKMRELQFNDGYCIDKVISSFSLMFLSVLGLVTLISSIGIKSTLIMLKY